LRALEHPRRPREQNFCVLGFQLYEYLDELITNCTMVLLITHTSLFLQISMIYPHPEDSNLCCLGAGTVPVPDMDTGMTFFKKLIYVYGHKLRYKYVSDTNTGTYPVSVLFLKWSTCFQTKSLKCMRFDSFLTNKFKI
jgi:hypothetical protein